MKSFLIISVLHFTAIQLSSAGRSERATECLVENGFNSTDLDILKAIRNPDSNISKDVSMKEKLACVLACLFRKENKINETLHAFLTISIDLDIQISEDTRKEMLETLNNCYAEAGQNDCKLLHCVKMIESPLFNDAFAVGEKLPEILRPCLKETQVTAKEIYFLKYGISESDVEKKASKDKVACSVACVFNKYKKGNITLYDILKQFINNDETKSEDTKKEMLETLNNCSTQAGGDNCKLLQCVDVTKPPFAERLINNMYSNN